MDPIENEFINPLTAQHNTALENTSVFESETTGTSNWKVIRDGKPESANGSLSFWTLLNFRQLWIQHKKMYLIGYQKQTAELCGSKKIKIKMMRFLIRIHEIRMFKM